MRVLRVIASMNPIGGGPREGLFRAASLHVDQGHSTDVICVDLPDSPWLKSDSKIGILAFGPGILGWAFSIKLFRWLKDNVQFYDAIIVHGLWLFPSFAVWLVTRSASSLKKRGDPKPPYFVYPHGMLDPYFQQASSRKLKAARNWVYWKLIESRVIRDAQGVLFTSEEERTRARETFTPYSARELVVPYGAAEPPPCSKALTEIFINQYSLIGEKPYLLFLSRIHPKKGVDLLIEAYLQLTAKIGLDRSSPNILPALVIAGPCEDRRYLEQLKQLAQSKSLDERNIYIHFLDLLTGDMKWSALYGCEALVLPSHQENFGIVVAEALGCGKPVLISNKVNIWRDIEKYGAGFVQNDDLEGVGDLLISWQSTPPEKRSKMSKAARNLFRERFTVAKAAADLIDILKLPRAS